MEREFLFDKNEDFGKVPKLITIVSSKKINYYINIIKWRRQ